MAKRMCLLSSAVFSQKGGITFRVVIAFGTLLLIFAIIFVLLQSFQQQGPESHRKALAISEYGLLETLQKIHENASLIKSTGKNQYEDGWYRIKTAQFKKNDTLFLTIISEGHVGSISEKRKCILRLDTLEGDSSWVRLDLF
jgi:hypothetical protein